MPSRFQQILDRTVAAVDQQFAEEVRLSPMKNGRLDPDRPQLTINAILRTGASKSGGIEGGQGRSWRSRLQAGAAELHVDRSRHPDVVIRKGDGLRALSRPGEPAFEALAVDDRNHVRLIVSLGEK